MPGAASGSPLKTIELTPAARRRKRGPPEKQITDKVAALLTESALYTQLLEFEGRVDSALARKKVDIQESIKIPIDTSFFTCDPPLRKLFREDKVKFALVSQKISQHLTAPQPIHLEHKIKLSGDNPVGNTCYDVLVDVPFSLDKDMSNFFENLEKHREIDACDEAICSAIKKIHEHRRRRAFFLG
ncbi:hypothetical protein L2E82_14025 [Cichorium intybus]|uniref:Uncharacterized protein n=1 Tax=Cichorium intybus TaxID=13427 RepID=A0ACB9EYX3_CICIN|nr:hypothetical protein L2E82_14025 [Cichorium intybus]